MPYAIFPTIWCRTCVVGCRSVCRCALLEVGELMRGGGRRPPVVEVPVVGELFLERRRGQFANDGLLGNCWRNGMTYDGYLERETS